jgi:hypothetical protein
MSDDIESQEGAKHPIRSSSKKVARDFTDTKKFHRPVLVEEARTPTFLHL